MEVIAAISAYLIRTHHYSIKCPPPSAPDGIWIESNIKLTHHGQNVTLQWFPFTPYRLDKTLSLADPEFFTKLDNAIYEWHMGS